MCGIVGYWAEPNLGYSLERMISAVSHRGPDGSRSLNLDAEGIALGHTRLSIIDLSSLGNQPMSLRSRGIHLVFNGEVYNFCELRRDLVADGYTFTGNSDTEVLLNLYAKHGHAMLEKLSGIFAFAIYDERTKELFLARDQLGVKPLYYTAGENTFAFGSELKVLLFGGFAKPNLDPDAVLAHLGFLWSPAPNTLVKDIKKLEPGFAMVVRRGRVERHWRYYDLPYGLPILNIDANSATRKVANAVETAVQRQMVADVPVGAFLSGGLDSSAVVAFAKRATTGHRIQCFSIDVKGGSTASEGFSPDLPYARKVAKHLDVDLHIVTVGPEMTDRLPEMIYYLDEPTADPAALNALFIAELARSQGIKVLLSGAGGDDIFTGYRRHYALRQEHYWSWMPAWIRNAMAGVAERTSTGTPFGRRFAKVIQYAGLGTEERLISYFLWTKPGMARNLLNKDFAAGLKVDALMAPLSKSLRNMPKGVCPLNQMLYLECKHFLSDHNLNYTDKMGMAAGVEVRVPLLDLDLVSLAAQLPSHFKQNGSVGKWIFKKAMEPYLPLDVIYRPKTGFGVPLREWLQTHLRPLLEDTLSASSINHRGIFDAGAVQKFVQLDRANRIDGTYTIFAMICLELWCRQYIDGHYAIFPHDERSIAVSV